MFAVKPLCLSCAQEELGSICVRAGIGHGQNAFSGVLQLEVLVLKLVAIDALATSPVVVGEVSTLAHEAWDDTVEGGASKAKALLSGAQCTEVFCCLGHNICSQLHHNPANVGAVGGHVEVNLWACHDG